MPKPCAFNLTRQAIHYRHDAFSAGLRAAGYEVKVGGWNAARPGDALLIWNRYGQYHEIATRFEKAGGTVLVAENGYLGADENGHQLYALARHAHNGAGDWSVGGLERWTALNVDLAPWRASGGHVLVCPNRSFGTPGNIMPPNWGNEVRDRLSRLTKREIRYRPHPGNSVPRRPLAEDLRNCWAVVIWSSSCGVAALVAGIPVICEAPFWICKPAALDRAADVEAFGLTQPWDRMGADATRLQALQRLAWAQWQLREIEDGTAFKWLLTPYAKLAYDAV